MGGGLDSRYVGRVYGADGAVHVALTLWRRNYFFFYFSTFCI